MLPHMAEAAGLRVRGCGAALREEPNDFLSNSRRSNATHNLSFPSRGSLQNLLGDNKKRSGLVQEEGEFSFHHGNEIPSIDSLEESLRKLQVQADSLASTLSSGEEGVLDSRPFSSRWPVAPGGSYEEPGLGGPPKTPAESEWFLKPRHLLRPVGDYSVLTHLGLPTFSVAPVNRVAGLLGSEIAGQNSSPSVDLAFPPKIGAPHVIGVKALLPPKIPVKARLPERATFSLDRGRSLSLHRARAALSQSVSPAAKRTRSRSQSPRPVWRPSSAKANACAQPPPEVGKAGTIRKNGGSSRQSRSRIYSPGTLAARSWAPARTTGRGGTDKFWSPYSLPSTAISSPTSQEINERFLQILAEGATGSSLIEISPYQQELARLWLERLRVEEAWLLELKRQQELERTRGPKPKWYEMRTSQFHYEAHKNNELLRHSQEIQSVQDYRQELATASEEFRRQPRSSHLGTHQ
ncbi:hypothetical protein EYD10_14021 [Varanus komodoensis]|nr:hypothetical protein EYD10_14021 [Varanus komodoensis]